MAIEVDYYKERIMELAKGGIDEEFYNSSERHARIVHLAIVQNADNFISFFCGGFPTDICDNAEYCRSMDKFLSKNPSRKVTIIIDDSVPKDELQSTFKQKNIAQVLQKYVLTNQVETYYYNGQVKYQKQRVHFTFADETMFRLETDTDKHKAFGNFGSKDGVKTLTDVFESIKKSEKTTRVNLFI